VVRHVVGMYKTRVSMKIFARKTEGRREVGNQRLRWLEDAENDLWELIVKSWRQNANNRK
jgi:hypothetical protein